MNARVPKKKTDSIRVDTGAKSIEVNDAGETIVLNFADQSFAPRFFAMVDEFNEKTGEFEAKAKKLDEDNAGLSEFESAKAVAAFNLEIHEFFKDRIDNLFGPDTCRKVFGPIVPGMECYTDFIEQLQPFFAKYGKEREAKIRKKYNATRKGNV